jgi:hypothetical protein
VKSDDQVNIVSLASFLSDAPFIEKLEIHVSTFLRPSLLVVIPYISDFLLVPCPMLCPLLLCTVTFQN